VSVFGSARTQRDDPEYAAGERIGAALARAGYAVITGGGPGIMEAVNKGCGEAAPLVFCASEASGQVGEAIFTSDTQVPRYD